MNGDKVRATLELEATMTAGDGVKRKTLAEMLSEGCLRAREGFQEARLGLRHKSWVVFSSSPMVTVLQQDY